MTGAKLLSLMTANNYYSYLVLIVELLKGCSC
jgi:hypothetical protein